MPDEAMDPVKAGRDVLVAGSKAQEETAKAVGKAIDLVRDAGRVFGPAADEFGSMLGEQMRYWRFRNLNRILSKVRQLADDGGLHPDSMRTLPFGDAFRVIEAASFEEEDSIQGLWANLIANAVASEDGLTVKKVYIETLRSISPAEASLLNLLWTGESKSQFQSRDEVTRFNQEMNALADSSWRLFTQDDRHTAAQHLVRLRCIAARPDQIDLSRIFTRYEDSRLPRGAGLQLDPQRFQSVIEALAQMSLVASGAADATRTKPIPLRLASGSFVGSFGQIEVPEMNFLLTPLGRDLMRACAAPKKPDTEA